MAESAVSFLISKFSPYLRSELNMLAGHETEVRYIIDELEHMRAFLRFADSKEQDVPELEVWTRQVREIAYDVEDVLDEYKLNFPNHGYGLCAWIQNTCDLIKGLIPLHQIASQIQTIKPRLENTSRNYERYKGMYHVIDQGETYYDGRGDALLLGDSDVVGIEDPKRKLLDWLKSTGGGPKVISVVGMAGMGKTTLAKKVYDDKSLKDAFQHHVWITVSESYKIEDLLSRMIKSLLNEVKQPMPQRLESMNADEMREFIYKFLQCTSYVVVLDDIWTIDAWEAMRYAFPITITNDRGYIIITTRFNSIANAASSDTRSHVHSLEPLKPEDAKLLFYKRAFSRNSCPLYLMEISLMILKRCEGLTLAIVVIGGLLATKNNDIQEWEMFNRSIGDELEGDNLKRLKKLISLSFYDLPYFLKSCFVYLSIFPEDAILPRLLLIRLWNAEGFVQEKHGKTMEEVADGYVNELVNRSLLQVVETDRVGTPESFRIHDLLREYIISKSRNEGFIASDRGDVRWTNNIRRIAIDASSKNVPETYSSDHLRSLLWFGLEDSSCEAILEKVLGRICRLLKVLFLERAPLESIPDGVFKLYHLKYLNLQETQVKLIPKSIKNLVNLESLNLWDTRVTKLPNEVVKLTKLRYLLVGRYEDDNFIGFQDPKDIGTMSSLHTLRLVNATEVGGVKIVVEIGKLTQLRTLGLTNLERKDGKDLCSSISKLRNLENLYLYSIDSEEVIDLEYPMRPTWSFPSLRVLILRGRLEKIPHWAPSLVGLTQLCLIGSRLGVGDQDPLERIQGLPNLQYLMMRLAYEGEGLIFRTKGFQRLNQLQLGSTEKLRWVKVEEGCMPHLQKLIMIDCKLMAEVPEGLRHLRNLQFVEFADMSEDFGNGVAAQKQKGKEEWELGHVPTVDIWNKVGGKWFKIIE